MANALDLIAIHDSSMKLHHQFVTVNQYRLHVVTAGPRDGQPVFLLHGFPEFWYGWHNQIAFLAEKGFRVIVPDQRGYNLSDKPKQVAAYHLDHLVDDVIALIDHFGFAKVFLAGHDWGAVVGWWLATKFPGRLYKLAILNVPYPSVAGKLIMNGDWRQLVKSWYVFFFQLPLIPELLMRALNRRSVLLLEVSSLRNTFSEDDYQRYFEALHRPGALRGMLNWYRALRLSIREIPEPEPNVILLPTLILWGEKDVALNKELAEMSAEMCANGRLQFFPSASHWVQHDAAEAVNEALLHFFTPQ